RAPASAGEMALSFAPVVRTAAPSVVNIYAERRVESPFRGDPRATNAWKVYQFTSGHKVDDRDRHMGGSIAAPTPVPTTAIYSRTDGICNWRNCIEEPSDIAENIEVRASHCGLGHDPAAAYAIADRLAQKEGEWSPFDRSGVKGVMYPKPSGA
ncbi:MAG: hypothetical protein AAF360_19205, partial [Pseudomonadota bacterium]